MNRLLDFFKDNGLSILTSILTSNPMPVALKAIGSLIGEDNPTEDDIIDKLSKDKQLMVQLQQIKLEEYRIQIEDKMDARNTEINILNSPHVNSFNKNLKGCLALIIILLIIILIVLELFSGNKISDYIWGTILGYGGSAVTYYFGSSDHKKE